MKPLKGTAPKRPDQRQFINSFQLPVFLPHPHTQAHKESPARQGPCGFVHCSDVNRQMNNSVYQMAPLFDTHAY